MNECTVREFAERVLLANTLEEKLAPPPPGVSLDPPARGTYAPPPLPGRPDTLLPRTPKDGRTAIPTARQLCNESHRSTLLHFFCNHELLAVELMALALLKFPDAPDAFRRGLLRTLMEEQEHTRLYLDRMAAAGVTFGEHHLSRMIWDHISSMASPLEYVSRLSLTFEQANLDYARHYGQAFAEAGDTESAALLERIYRDEIAHVGYGLKWLRRFKEEKESDWDAWHRSLSFPLSPVRAKGPEPGVPFNQEGRKLAGLDDDFIKRLQLYQRSRGRTPVVHWFNPNGESHAAAARLGLPSPNPKGAALALESDLEALLLANALPDDICLFRERPSDGHLMRLREAGLVLPEIVTVAENIAEERKLGGFAPWAWTPDACDLLRPWSNQVSPGSQQGFREAYPPEFFSKQLTPRLVELLGLQGNDVVATRLPGETTDNARSMMKSPESSLGILLKASHACAGRDHFRVGHEDDELTVLSWVDGILARHPAIVIEPFLDRLADFSALYEISSSWECRFLSFTLLETDPAGRYLGTTVGPKFASLLPGGLAKAFHQPLITLANRKVAADEFYRKILTTALPPLLPGYQGPVAVDAFFHRIDGDEIAIRPLVEINARCTMGRIAHNLWKKLMPRHGGRLRIDRAGCEIAEGSLPLNDPAKARRFQACWTELTT